MSEDGKGVPRTSLNDGIHHIVICKECGMNPAHIKLKGDGMVCARCYLDHHWEEFTDEGGSQ